MRSHVIMICLHKHHCGLISSKSNHLPSFPTSITCSPPSKDVGRVRKHSMPLKQHGRQPRLPLPTPSTLPRHSTSSIENASPGLLPPSSLPRHLTLSVKDTFPGLPPPSHPLLCHVTRDRASKTPPLVCHRPPSLDVECRGCLPTCHCPFALCFAMSLDVKC
jgi:hypothetical protein